MKKLVSWNVNGLRAILKKNFKEAIEELNPDILCLQEIKMQEGQLTLDIPEYHQYYNYAEKKGYSGTALFSKEKPHTVDIGMNIPEHDTEGRVITAYFEKYTVITVYTPNAQDGLKRISYRMEWEDAFRNYVTEVAKKNPLFICGDLNVAHKEIDLTHPDKNRQSPGFSDEERNKFSILLNSGFVDTFRHFYPDKKEIYTWWSYRSLARQRNIGWRIDYFLASTLAVPLLEDAKIHDKILGSDHCPVEITIKD